MSNPPVANSKLVNPPQSPNKMQNPPKDSVKKNDDEARAATRKVSILQTVRVDLDGVSKALNKGQVYELPEELALQLVKPVKGMYTFRGESSRIEEMGMIQRAALVD